MAKKQKQKNPDRVKPDRLNFNAQGAIRRLVQSEGTDEEIDDKLFKLIRTARGYGREKEMVDALLTLDIKYFKTMETAESVLRLAAKTGQTAEVIERFNGFRSKDVSPPRWALSSRKKAMRKRLDTAGVSRDHFKQLVGLKYVQSPDKFATLKEAMEFYAPRLDLPEELVDRLFENRSDKTIERAAFVDRLRRGFAFEHMLTDLYGRDGKAWTHIPTVKDDGKLWHDDVFGYPFPVEEGKARPKLILTFHGAMFLQVKAWYKRALPDGFRIGTKLTEKSVSSAMNANGALLEAYRSLVGGKPMLVAADSPLGTAKNVLTVLGGELPVADGFVFLAFEAKADVYWLVVVAEEGRLRPRLVRGPSRETGEKMPAYRERLIAFVNQQITDYVTGAPEEFNVPAKWRELLSGRGGSEGGAEAPEA